MMKHILGTPRNHSGRLVVVVSLGVHVMMNDVQIRQWNAIPLTFDDKVCAARPLVACYHRDARSRTQWNVFQLLRRRQTSHSYECKDSAKFRLSEENTNKFFIPTAETLPCHHDSARNDKNSRPCIPHSRLFFTFHSSLFTLPFYSPIAAKTSTSKTATRL